MASSLGKRGRKPGPVWQFFKLDEEKKHAICNACGTKRCKNIVTLENHLAACSKMTEESSAAWQAILDERKQAPAAKKRRKTSVCPREPCSRSRSVTQRNMSGTMFWAAC